MSFPVQVLKTIRDKINSGEVVKYHISEFGYGGTQPVIYSNNSIANSAARGFDSFIAFQTNAGLGTSSSVSFWVFGSVVGIGLADNATSFDVLQYPDASVIVDGVCYGLRDNCIRVSNPPNTTATTASESVFYVPEILDYDWHRVTILLHSLPSSDHPIYFYNIFAEKNLLEVQLNSRSSNYATAGTLTTSDVAVPIVLQSTVLNNSRPKQTVYFLEKITYYNNDTVDRTVTVSNNSVIVFSKVIPAKQTIEFIPSMNGLGLRQSDVSLLTHKGEVSSFITFSTILNVN